MFFDWVAVDDEGNPCDVVTGVTHPLGGGGVGRETVPRTAEQGNCRRSWTLSASRSSRSGGARKSSNGRRS